MITKKTKIETYYEHAMCECGGEFLPKPHDPFEPIVDCALAIYPPAPKTYVHICNKCCKEEIFLKIYPTLVYEEINK